MRLSFLGTWVRIPPAPLQNKTSKAPHRIDTALFMMKSHEQSVYPFFLRRRMFSGIWLEMQMIWHFRCGLIRMNLVGLTAANKYFFRCLFFALSRGAKIEMIRWFWVENTMRKFVRVNFDFILFAWFVQLFYSVECVNCTISGKRKNHYMERLAEKLKME